ncbi:MAG: guanylate kinase [Candidatus Omnitrophica bacterium]|nr:guanylate kinase [Candidatus Omnitrophota bacterium]
MQTQPPTPGIPIVVSGPSGVGKGTLIAEVMKLCPGLILSVSMTTRLPRPGEQEGVNYFYVTKERFREAIENNEMAEWASVYENYYGTLRRYLNEQFEKGLDVILDIDVQGAAAIRTLYSGAVLVYILPPSMEALRRRLYSRPKSEHDDLESRLQQARREMRFYGVFDYLLVNDKLEEAVQNLNHIINAHRLQRRRLEAALQKQNLLPGLSSE